jgi:SOS-response transcriptional repressor LexA
VANSPSLRQLEYLAAIRRHWEARGYAPSIRFLTVALRADGKPLSTNAVAGVLCVLEKHGWVKRDSNTARSLRLTPRGLSFVPAGPGGESTPRHHASPEGTAAAGERPSSGASATNATLPERLRCHVPQPSALGTRRGGA